MPVAGMTLIQVFVSVVFALVTIAVFCYFYTDEIIIQRSSHGVDQIQEKKSETATTATWRGGSVHLSSVASPTTLFGNNLKSNNDTDDTKPALSVSQEHPAPSYEVVASKNNNNNKKRIKGLQRPDVAPDVKTPFNNNNKKKKKWKMTSSNGKNSPKATLTSSNTKNNNNNKKKKASKYGNNNNSPKANKLAAAARKAINIQFYPPSLPLVPYKNKRGGNITHFPPKFRLTRLDPSPILGQKKTIYEGHIESPRYQCAGPEYDEFITKAAQMVHGRVQSTKDNERLNGWGKRPTILPPTASGKPYKILMVGNSHTRQVAESLEWQYKEQVTSVGNFHMNVQQTGHHAATFRFAFNTEAPYSSRWQQNLERDVLRMPLKEFDAIVLGLFNPYNPTYAKTSRMWMRIQRYATSHKPQEIDLIHHPNGFQLQDLMDVYDGPIIHLSSFALCFAWQYKHNMRIALNAYLKANRTNIRMVDSRAPINAIGDGGECGHDNTDNVVVCNATQRQHHRCMGDKGGPADFAAWDLIEAFYDVLEETGTTDHTTSHHSSANILQAGSMKHGNNHGQAADTNQRSQVRGAKAPTSVSTPNQKEYPAPYQLVAANKKKMKIKGLVAAAKMTSSATGKNKKKKASNNGNNSSINKEKKMTNKSSPLVASAQKAVNIQFYPPHLVDDDASSHHKITEFPPEFRVARLNPSPILGNNTIKYPDHGETPRYQCAGTEYDGFIQKAVEMVHERDQLAADIDEKMNVWGRRPTMLPPGRHYEILYLGNSHSRQVAQSLDWQYHDQVKENSPSAIIFKKQFLSSTIRKIFNHAAVYSSRWKTNLEEILGRPLEEYDAIILGKFNSYDPNYKDSVYWTGIKNYAKRNTRQEVNAEQSPDGFMLQDLIDAYNGPIVSMTSFSKQYEPLYEHNKQIAINAYVKANRTNIRVINSRASIHAWGGNECAVGADNKVGICYTRRGNSHRCMGDKGGIPDFAAWDMIEAFYDLLE